MHRLIPLAHALQLDNAKPSVEFCLLEHLHRWMFSFMTPIVSRARVGSVALDDCLLPTDQTADGKHAHAHARTHARAHQKSSNAAQGRHLITQAFLSPPRAVAYEKFSANWEAAKAKT
jgi:hypothetical protein